ncbi:MAG TPA: zinc-binding dehydrogenase, partial [Candidatus Binatia bacterium]|nr:zinc-binding dehydrogenase [Candidatus Binatia bacterium]
ATHSVLPEESVIPIRKDAPLDVVCLVSCGVLAGAGPVFNRAKVPPGASVAVWGCGGVGLNTVQAARLVGAGKIIAVDVVKQKLAWAEEFGATHVVDASQEDPVGHQRTDVPMLIDLYMSGKYRIEELISRRLPLGELNHAFDLMLQGEVKRSVIVYQ